MRQRCRLCRRQANLRRSHIISKFALRDAQGDAARPLLRVSTREPPRVSRDQAWDQEHLLCGDCEDRRCRWEGIVAAALAGRGDGREPRPDLYIDGNYSGKLSTARPARAI